MPHQVTVDRVASEQAHCALEALEIQRNTVPGPQSPIPPELAELKNESDQWSERVVAAGITSLQTREPRSPVKDEVYETLKASSNRLSLRSSSDGQTLGTGTEPDAGETGGLTPSKEAKAAQAEIEKLRKQIEKLESAMEVVQGFPDSVGKIGRVEEIEGQLAQTTAALAASERKHESMLKTRRLDDTLTLGTVLMHHASESDSTQQVHLDRAEFPNPKLPRPLTPTLIGAEYERH